MDGVTRDFLHFEKERALFERRYCGIPYWQEIRFKIGLMVTGLANVDEVTSNAKKRKWWGRFLLCIGFLKDVLDYYHLKKCDILYFDQGLEGAYRNIDGKMKDIYFGYFDYEDKYRVERCYYIKGNKRNTQKHGVGVDLILPYRLKIKIQFLLNPKNNIDSKEDIVLRNLCNDINKRYNVNISADTIIREIQCNCKLHRIYEKYYRKLFKKTEPKVIILQCYYSDMFFPLYKIAKEFSIPVIELQHGQMCNHLAYNYFDTSNRGKELPDYIFTYGDFWKEQIQLPTEVQILSIGNPFLEAMKIKYRDQIPNEKAIVFYSGTYSFDGKELEDIAVDFYEKYGREGYKIYFKFHPGEKDVWQKKYQLLSNCEGIKIVAPDMSVYQLFAMAKHHVGVISTTLFEAMGFPICRYIYKIEKIREDALEAYLPLVKTGGMQEFSTMEELKDLINKKTNIELDFIDKMWKPDAKENGQRALKKIMDKPKKFLQ